MSGQVAAEAALSDQPYSDWLVQETVEQREALADSLRLVPLRFFYMQTFLTKLLPYTPERILNQGPTLAADTCRIANWPPPKVGMLSLSGAPRFKLGPSCHNLSGSKSGLPRFVARFAVRVSAPLVGTRAPQQTTCLSK